MPVLQQYQLWIGFGLALFLILFFIVAFFKAKDLTRGQHTILKFLSSMCAGFAGALITGDALFRAEGSVGGGLTYAITGATGFALFFVVWFFFPKHQDSPPIISDSINFSIPKGCTFKDAVECLVQNDRAVADYKNFTNKELKTPLQERELHEKTVSDAISRLRFVTVKSNAIPEYKVKYSNSVYCLEKKL